MGPSFSPILCISYLITGCLIWYLNGVIILIKIWLYKILKMSNPAECCIQVSWMLYEETTLSKAPNSGVLPCSTIKWVREKARFWCYNKVPVERHSRCRRKLCVLFWSDFLPLGYCIKGKPYVYDHVFEPTAGQESVYIGAAYHIVRDVLRLASNNPMLCNNLLSAGIMAPSLRMVKRLRGKHIRWRVRMRSLALFLG